MPTYHATDHLYRLGMDLWDVAAILESGEDCEEGPRRSGIRERCSEWRGRRIRVVASREPTGWVEGKDAWIVLAVKVLARRSR